MGIKPDYKQKQKEEFKEEELAVTIIAGLLFALLCVITYLLLVMVSV